MTFQRNFISITYEMAMERIELERETASKACNDDGSRYSPCILHCPSMTMKLDKSNCEIRLSNA